MQIVSELLFSCSQYAILLTSPLSPSHSFQITKEEEEEEEEDLRISFH